MHKLEQHQQITPLTATSVADQGIAYLKYQQALIFPFEGSVFNALMVIGLAYMYSRLTPGSQDLIFAPNVNSRPVRINSVETWTDLLNKAYVTYESACIVYETELEAMRERVTRIFDSPFVDNDLGDEDELAGDTCHKE
jgi:hypothetical protein